MRYPLIIGSFCALLALSMAWGEEPATTPAAPAVTAVEEVKAAEPPGVSRAFILCGLAGDDEHRKLFAETLERLYSGLTTHHGFQPEQVVVLWGDETLEADGPALRSSRGVASRETVEGTLAQLHKDVQTEDRLWVFVLGHAHYDGRYSWLNLPGPDIQHVEFGKQLAGFRCREQVIFVTTPASGFFHKSLAAPGRVVITATEPDLEVNETLFPQHLARTLAEPPASGELDLDKDGLLTLLDAYLWTCQQTAQEYATNMLLATEHALLDDSGDGRGTEVQADYLSEELGGRRRADRKTSPLRSGDGALARQIQLRHPSPPPAAAATEDKTAE